MPLHTYAAPFAQGLQIRCNRRGGAGFWSGLAAAAMAFSTVLDCTPTELHNYLPAQLHG